MNTYFALIHKDPDSAWGVSFPDLPGCFSAADEEANIYENAQQALSLFADGGLELPPARTLSDLLDDPAIKAEIARGAVLIGIPLIVVGKKARYNVMLDPGLVDGVDSAARSAGVSRSEYISQALGKRLRQDVGAQSVSKKAAFAAAKAKRNSQTDKVPKSAAASVLTQKKNRGSGDSVHVVSNDGKSGRFASSSSSKKPGGKRSA